MFLEPVRTRVQRNRALGQLMVRSDNGCRALAVCWVFVIMLIQQPSLAHGWIAERWHTNLWNAFGARLRETLCVESASHIDISVASEAMLGLNAEANLSGNLVLLKRARLWDTRFRRLDLFRLSLHH